MKDLIDIHRANIAKAGVTLAERIASATADYSAEVAMSEAALAVQMDRRVEAFNGTLAIEDQRSESDKQKDEPDKESVKTPD